MPTAIVTGASGGLGLAVTNALIAAGWEVLAQYHTHPGTIDNAVWWRADFCHPSPEFDHLPHRGKIHALIHCAGTVIRTRCEDAFIDDLNSSMDIHFTTPMLLTNQCLPMLRKTGGHVIYVNAVSSSEPVAEFAPYCASKAAATAWLGCLREEEPRIRVTNLIADNLDTPLRRAVLAEDDERYDPGDYLNPAYVANMIVYLLQTPQALDTPTVTVTPRCQ